jgi:hypothetical protein
LVDDRFGETEAIDAVADIQAAVPADRDVFCARDFERDVLGIVSWATTKSYSN